MTVLLVILLLAAGLAIFIYNRLVKDRNRVSAAWSDIDVQLERRYDLIPQLVKAVDQYAKYEKTTLEAVATLRAKAQQLKDTPDIDARGQVEEALSAGVQKLVALVENYPDLKANENFLSLQQQLVDTENYLQFARRFYNGSVRQFNTRIETVPDNIVAGLFGFNPRAYFQKTSDEAATVPLVNLGRIE